MFRYVLVLSLFLFFISCKKINSFTQFEMSYNQEVVIPSSTGINLPVNFYTPETQTNSETTFEVNDTRKDLIESVLLNQLTLSILIPENGDFSFLNSLSIYISSENLPELKIAWKEDIDGNNVDEIDLIVTSEDLQEYVKESSFTLKVNMVTDEILNEEYKLNVYSLYFIDAKLKK